MTAVQPRSGLPDTTGMSGRWLTVAGGGAAWSPLPSLDLVPTASADVDVGGNQIVNAAAGVASTDVATVGQLPVAQAPTVALAPLRAKSDLSGWENHVIDGSGIDTSVALAGSPTTTTQARTDTSTKVATTQHVRNVVTRRTLTRGANPNFARIGDAGQAVNTALVPFFYLIDPPPEGALVLSSLAVRVTTLVAGGLAGVAVYSLTVASGPTITGTLLGSITADLDCSSAGYKIGSFSTGGFGGSAGTLTFDFTQTYYLVAGMASTTTTLKFAGNGIGTAAKSGIYLWSGVARSSVHDWPSSFTNSDVSTGAQMFAVDLLTADAANLK